MRDDEVHEPPYTLVEAEEIIRNCLSGGTVAFRFHADERGRERAIARVDIENCLRGGTVVNVEWRVNERTGHGSWRWECQTDRYTVIIAIRNRAKISVITCWRNG